MSELPTIPTPITITVEGGTEEPLSVKASAYALITIDDGNINTASNLSKTLLLRYLLGVVFQIAGPKESTCECEDLETRLETLETELADLTAKLRNV